jgi:hypothetical protein
MFIPGTDGASAEPTTSLVSTARAAATNFRRSFQQP